MELQQLVSNGNKWYKAAFCSLVLFFQGCGGSSGNGNVDRDQPIIIPSSPNQSQQTELTFKDGTVASGLSRTWAIQAALATDSEYMASGLAAVDYDLDGDIDVYVSGGNSQPNKLFENQGNGTFSDIAASVGLNLTHKGSGPTFADIDQDGDLDLFIGSVEGDAYFVLENRDGLFLDVTEESGILLNAPNTFSAAFADYDRDGDLDIALSHWGNPEREDTETLWRNRGNGTFESASVASRIAATIIDSSDPQELQIRAPGFRKDNSFTPNFVDIDSDMDLDLLMVSDFRTSQIFVNNADGTFTKTTQRTVIKDQAGMGAAVADYDNDGDMDWFVTSIYKEAENTEEIIGYGNRLYANDGMGGFSDVTDVAGVRDGGWGWAACFADFDNDGLEDIFHVNGWRESSTKEANDYENDAARLFHNQGDGTFLEIAKSVGLEERGQGRGVACFDADRDGDIDLLIANNEEQQLKYFRNDLSSENRYITVRLQDFGIGAKIRILTGIGTRVKEITAGSNYVSQNPMEAHFGVGNSEVVDVLVEWPDGTTTEVQNVETNQLIHIDKDGLPTDIVLNVLRGQGGGDYKEGELVTINADKPPEGYFFGNWTTEGSVSIEDPFSASTTLTISRGAATVIANFLPGIGPAEAVSAARRWNELLLQAIRNDFARPTVHARNLFHSSAAMYDAWATYDSSARPYLLGQTIAGVSCTQTSSNIPDDVEGAREEAISYAMYRLIRHRFATSPGASLITRDAQALMSYLGYDTDDDSTDYIDGSAAALGNHIAQCYIDLGLADGSNEANGYANVAYTPVNPALEPELPGNPNIVDLNHWQPLKLSVSIDQAGNLVTTEPTFLSPEWGRVRPFALEENDRTIYERDGYEYWVYHDPGGPPTIDGTLSDNYKWAFSLVAIWSSHLQPDVDLMIDISPASLGNITSYPTQFEEYPAFYNTFDGGDPSKGYDINPVTGAAYIPQEVPLGDYARVLAEFWADGPDSETPPGHWFVILNTVSEHELLQKRFAGVGPELGVLEWDIKAYFTLGGAMHDAAVTAWGIKGWYDYVRPISTLRAMADRGQSSEPNGVSYHIDGIPLEPGYIEVVETGDALAGDDNEHVGKIKFLSWKGPTYINDPTFDEANVDWILAENWWPYQRPTFVTPPFAGYISGHSTYSRAAAEVMTALTGDAYFPGGMSSFEVPANEFLVFEEGPSVDMTLQWATYRDASDQCSLSRIWGGIHPPVDDIPGRLIGIKIGQNAFNLAKQYFRNE